MSFEYCDSISLTLSMTDCDKSSSIFPVLPLELVPLRLSLIETNALGNFKYSNTEETSSLETSK